MFDDFLVRALLAGIGLALVTGPAGCFIVWRRLAYFGETISHSALLGVALAILFDFDLTIGIFAVASAVVLAMFYLERRDTLPTDTLLGLLAHGGLAVGLVTLSFFPNMRMDLQALLFGDILAVSRTDLALIWIGGALALGVLCLIWRPLLAATVSPDLAKVAGMNPERARLIFGIFSGRGHCRGHQGCGCVADRRSADHTCSDRSPIRLQSGTHGSGRCRRRHRRSRRRASGVGKFRYSVGPLHCGGRPGVVRGHANTLLPFDGKRTLTGPVFSRKFFS